MGAYERVAEKLERGATVVLGGPMGSELVRRGVRWRGHGMRTDAAAVQALHEEYLAAGADVIRTNTLQLNRRIYLNVFHNLAHMRHIGAPGLETRAVELTQRAVQLACAARDRSGRSAAIAGVLSPLEHCFRPDLAPGEEAEAEHAELAGVMRDGGVDLFLLESMNTLRETRAALHAAAATGLPVWVSYVIGPEGNLLSGEPLDEAASEARALGASAVLVNCAPPEDIGSAVPRLEAREHAPTGAFPHVGKFDPPSWKFEFFPQFVETRVWSPERLAQAASMWRAQGARIVGGCCGTGPDHTRALVEAFGGAQ